MNQDKREFANDFSKMSDLDVLEIIRYLRQNYKKYKITLVNDKCLKLDNISISTKTRKIEGEGYECYRTCWDINGKIFNIEEEEAIELEDLFNICKNKVAPLSKKISRIWDDNKNLIIGGTSVVAICTLFGWGVYELNKKYENKQQKAKQEFKQEIIKEALDAFKKEQEKTVNFNDTINNRSR